MSLTPAAFAIPGDLGQTTGGYIYERKLIDALRAQGRRVDHIALPASFPDAGSEDLALSEALLAAVPAAQPLIIDGLAFGAIDTGILRRLTSPLIAMIHHPLGLESGLPPERAAALLRREADNLALAAHVLVPSPHIGTLLASEFGVEAARISVALPGFARPAPGRTLATPPLILSVGILAARKGHDILLEALAELRDLDWRAEIVGAPHEPGIAEALADQCGRLGLSDRVRFSGLLPAPALEARFRQAHVFALATRYEGYGMVISEAISHGLPVVSCAVGAVPDTLPPGAGRLVPPDDAPAFAAALRELLCDPAAAHAMTEAATAAAQVLPGWNDTAAIAAAAIDRVGSRA